MFFSVNQNSFSPPGCCWYHSRTTSNWHVAELVAPAGAAPAT